MHPDNLTVVLGANASFHCGSSSPGRTIAWLVTFTTSGDTLDSTNNNDAEQLVIRGITIQTSSRMATNLIVLAVEGNNNTIVQCRRPFPTTFSYKGSLMVLGRLTDLNLRANSLQVYLHLDIYNLPSGFRDIV